MDIKIFDNDGKTVERYTLIVNNESVYTLSGDSLSRLRARYLCEAIDLDREEAGRPIAIEDLPKEVLKLIELTEMHGSERRPDEEDPRDRR